MKKILTLSIVLLIAFATGKSQTNLIQGGNMELDDEDFWSVTTLETDETNSSSYDFGYTDETPYDGVDGCLHYTINNTGVNGAHLMFYQEITLSRGVNYIFDLDARAVQTMNNSWFEVYLGSTEPADGADYGSGQTALGGFKWSEWEANCTDLDLFDGSLREIGCLAGSSDTILLEGTGDSTVYIGFKAGIWATEATVEFAIDNVSLIEIEGGYNGISSKRTKQAELYPNPTSDILHIEASETYSSVRVLSILGQEVLAAEKNATSLDISSLNAGIYVVQLIGQNNRIETHRIRKN